MVQISLYLAFAAGGIANLTMLLYGLGLPAWVPYPYLAFSLPALLYGLLSFRGVHCFGRSAPVIACCGLALAGVAWVDPSERGRGLLIAAAIATSIPIAALAIRMKAVRWCTQLFIAASLVTFIVIACYTQTHTDQRFGTVIVAGVGKVSNPNGIGGQMALAAILSIALFLEDRQPQRTARRDTRVLPIGAYLLLAAVFYLGVLLSASRGALISLAGASILIMAGGKATGSLGMRRLVVVGALCAISLWAMESVKFVTSRFQDGESVTSIGDRVYIWQAALDAVGSDRSRFLFGVGTGGVDKVLAEYASWNLPVKRGDDGIARLSSHNSYVEWWVSYGIVGCLSGLWLALAVLGRARRLDALEGTGIRTALVAYCLLFSMSTPLYKSLFVIPLATLLLCLLSGASLSRVACRAGGRAVPDRRGVTKRRKRVPTQPPRSGHLGIPTQG